MNEFVNYLNSTNNVGGNTTGSLAESQVKSDFYDLVKVDRKLGNFITQTIKDKAYQAFVLTGHAGDGKTSVLVQVLKQLGRLNAGEGLCQEKAYPDFYYVKDMSEIAENDQRRVLEQSLSSPQNGKTSLLISNTGPLLNTFLRLAEYSRKINGQEFVEADRIELQSKLLTQLDKNSDELIEVENYQFYLINIARLDNVSFSTAILEKILSDKLWGKCESCQCKNRCPIINNVKNVAAQKKRVSRFIESYYRFLYENDRRMTIRQMVGQMSFALTGNLSCDDILSKYLKEPLFNFNFANLFFGYVGLNEDRDSSQIKGISQIKLLGLDSKALDIDYKLFVKNDYSLFTPEIGHKIEELCQKHMKHYQIVDEESVFSSSELLMEAKLRRAIRRFYLIFGADQREEIVFDQIFGKNFVLYERLVAKKQPKSELRIVQTLLFKALYMKNTGFLPENTNELPLTLRRENSVFQNVMLVLGTVSKNDLTVVQRPLLNKFEEVEDRQEICLKIKDSLFLVNLPMLSYFDDLVKGAISSNSNPALTHGIAKLDALLLELFGDEVPESEDDCELKVLVNTSSGQKIRCYAFDGNKLSILS